ncbi:methylthioribulose 1-phosphate dehydratase [Macrococcus hajekii]|uniref:Methylthioribulose-1-phosphate dehydratase n=1 Tax=Macrococcus hajekii TaxID=198482 RepID=A0A4R6BHY7_9STAP|nr:methylthioribulose 1-phosphate dehydratase [Macrococcus hajekii]TDM01214.1 methylthioribulose 1-phosphate dehydratase [Macrococcus hajekii]GGB11628.1 methylthioribulose-1-phosphate dehydratase [Macrococcus hajekii]
MTCDVRHNLSIVKERLAARNLFPGTSGNLGIRNDDNTLLVTTSGVDKYITNNQSFVHVSATGEPLEELKPSLETQLHVEIFKRTKARTSIHIHTVSNNVISEIYGDCGSIEFRHQELIKAFGLWQEDDVLRIPIIENPSDINQLAHLLVPHIQSDYGIVLIRNHGVNVWGRTSTEALKLFEAAEFLFEYQLQLNAARHYIKGEM